MFIEEINDRLIEECSELIHILSKAKRFGYINYHPNNPSLCNAELVISEIIDVQILMSDILPKLESIRESFHNNSEKAKE